MRSVFAERSARLVYEGPCHVLLSLRPGTDDVIDLINSLIMLLAITNVWLFWSHCHAMVWCSNKLLPHTLGRQL